MRNNDTDKHTVRAWSDAASLRSDYLEAWQLSSKEHFENSIEWFELLQKHVFSDDSHTRYYVASDQAMRPIALLPLRLITQGWTKQIKSLSNFYTSLYSPLLAGVEARNQLHRLLAESVKDFKGANVIRFAPMDAESHEFKSLLEGIRALGWIPFRYFCFHNWYLKNPDNWNDYLQGRSRNLRDSIKRRRKQFAASGGIIEIISGMSDDIDTAIASFHEVYRASWKVPEPYPDFIPALIHHLARSGLLRLGIARLDGKPIAAQLWIVTGKTASIYKVAYHEDFASYSPGTVLTSYLLEHAIENDHVEEVDFLIGDDEYKKKWMSDRRERWGIVAYNPRSPRGIALLIIELLGRGTKQIRQKLKSMLGKPKTTNSKKLLDDYSK